MPERDDIRDLNIAYRDPCDLRPRARNARMHTKAQLRQIAASIETFGFTNPVLLDGAGEIIAGHGRVEAAKLLGLDRVPTITLAGLTPEQVRAYVIADNRIAENAGWDMDLLALELAELDALSVDLELDLTVTGFETAQIDLMIAGRANDDAPEIEEDAVPELAPGPAVSVAGDLWHVGPHRLICGDALDGGVYARLLDGEAAQMVFTDPPYNVAIDGHVSGLGRHTHREFEMASGEMTSAAFAAFLTDAFSHLATYSADGAIQFVCMDWRHMEELLAAGRTAFSDLKNLCVWSKTNGGMGSLYRSQHELVFVFKAGGGSHINNVELGRHGRNRTNVWTYPGVNAFGTDRDAALAMHPTVKPVELVYDAILDCSHRGGVILDPFAGSGTTLVAAHKAGRRGYGVEIDPHYCDVIVRRLEQVSGEPATHDATGETFEDRARREHAEGPQQASGGDAGGKRGRLGIDDVGDAPVSGPAPDAEGDPVAVGEVLS